MKNSPQYPIPSEFDALLPSMGIINFQASAFSLQRLAFRLRLQTETAAEMDAMLPAILDRAFKGEL